MIFILLNCATGDKVVLTSEKDNIIGRKNATIELENPSVSRKHAVIRIKNNEAVLADCAPKFFTYCNKAKIESGAEIKLNHLDQLCFAADPTIFRFEKYEFVTAASGLPLANKKLLCNYVQDCGGKFVNEWSNICTHLTVGTISITTKFLQAIIDEKPVVSLDYWSKYSAAIKNRTSLPPVPQLTDLPVDKTISSFNISKCKPDPKRKRLFKNKIFVFYTSEKMKQMETVIKYCGGECVAWEKLQDFTTEMNKNPKEYLFIASDNFSLESNQSNDSFKSIRDDLKMEKKRIIEPSEVALAILYCSCHVNCNPNASKVKTVFPTDTEIQETAEVLAKETETHDYIPETLIINTIEATENIINTIEPTENVIHTIDLTENMESAEDIFSGQKRKRPVGKIISEKRAKIVENSQHVQTLCVINPVASCSKSTDKYISATKKPPQSQKRKAENNNEMANKKPNLFKSINLNKSISSSNGSENPFKLTRNIKTTKSSELRDANPFSNIGTIDRKANDTLAREQVMESVKESNKLIKSEKIELRTSIKIEDVKYNPSMQNSVLSLKWISKSNHGQIKNATNILNNPELLKVLEAFENCVRVEIKDMSARSIHSISGVGEPLTTIKNFKKFKKILPLRPQKNIVDSQIYRKVDMRNVQQFEDTVKKTFSDDEDNNSLNQVVNKSKPKTRKFIF